jgi:putative transposase
VRWGGRSYRGAVHRVYECHYHFVFITRYRKPVLKGEIALATRDIARQVCHAHDIEILAGHVRPNHVHLLLSVPPHLAPSRVMQAIKGRTSHRLLHDWWRLRTEFWGQVPVGRGTSSARVAT